MNEFAAPLCRLFAALTELEEVLLDEIAQLSRIQINAVSLQVISDRKSRLLSAVSFYDGQRRATDQQLQIASPYSSHPELARSWERIIHKVKRTRELSERSCCLLDRHMQKISELKKLITCTSGTPALYDAEGMPGRSFPDRNFRILV